MQKDSLPTSFSSHVRLSSLSYKMSSSMEERKLISCLLRLISYLKRVCFSLHDYYTNNFYTNFYVKDFENFGTQGNNLKIVRSALNFLLSPQKAHHARSIHFRADWNNMVRMLQTRNDTGLFIKSQYFLLIFYNEQSKFYQLEEGRGIIVFIFVCQQCRPLCVFIAVVN